MLMCRAVPLKCLLPPQVRLARKYEELDTRRWCDSRRFQVHCRITSAHACPLQRHHAATMNSVGSTQRNLARLLQEMRIEASQLLSTPNHNLIAPFRALDPSSSTAQARHHPRPHDRPHSRLELTACYEGATMISLSSEHLHSALCVHIVRF